MRLWLANIVPAPRERLQAARIKGLHRIAVRGVARRPCDAR